MRRKPGLDRDRMRIHEYSIEILYHMKCGECDNWWSYAYTPYGDEFPQDPHYMMSVRKFHCPHCGAQGVMEPVE